MNQIAKVDNNPAAQLRSQLAKMSPEFQSALPSHIKPDRFQRVVMTVAQTDQDLLLADRRTLLSACLKCAADGLVPDGREAALVIFNKNIAPRGAPKQWVKAVQYMPMLAGLQKRVRNSGDIASIEAHVIYEQDHFVWEQGLHGNLDHKPKFPGPRGKPIGAYAVARFKDGSDPQFEVMDVEEINRVRAVSRSKDDGPWVQWWSEMARKTVFRRLSKWLPMDAETERLMRRDDEIGVPTEISGPTIEGHSTEQAQIESSGKLDDLEQTIESDPETGEIIDDFPGVVTCDNEANANRFPTEE